MGLVNGSPNATAASIASYKAASAATAAAAAVAVAVDAQGDDDSQLWADAAEPRDRDRRDGPAAPPLSLQ